MVYRKLVNILSHYLPTLRRRYDICDPTQNGEFRILRNVIKNLNPFVLFDVGANEGDYSAQAIDYCKEFNHDYELHLFEPQVDYFIKLKDKFKDYENVTINNFALSKENSKKTLYGDATLASLYRRNGINKSKKQISIDAYSLDSYVQNKEISQISYLKLDTEGSELDIMKGGMDLIRLGIVRNIQFEYGGTYKDADIKLMDVYSNLTEFYKIGKIFPRKIRYSKYSHKIEDYSYSNYFAKLRV